MTPLWKQTVFLSNLLASFLNLIGMGWSCIKTWDRLRNSGRDTRDRLEYCVLFFQNLASRMEILLFADQKAHRDV